MGKPLVRFCEGREFNGDMEEILWHRRETRRQTEKTNLSLQPWKAPVYSTTIIKATRMKRGMSIIATTMPMNVPSIVIFTA